MSEKPSAREMASAQWDIDALERAGQYPCLVMVWHHMQSQLAQARADALEEAAGVAEKYRDEQVPVFIGSEKQCGYRRQAAGSIADAIRELK